MKPTIKNTKEEILRAYAEVEAKLKEKEAVKLNPVKEAEEKKAVATVQKAEVAVSGNIQNKIEGLNKEIIGIFEDLLANIEGAKEEYNSIKEAIALKQAELKEMFDIEKSAFTLAALINTQQETRENFAAEYDAARTEKKAELAALEAELIEKEKAFRDKIAAEDKAIKEARAKEKVEYDYEFNRQKMLAKNAWDDEMAVAKKNFADTLNKELDSVNAKNKELTAKEADLVKREEKMADLESQVALIPSIKEQTAAIAADQAKKEVEKTAAIKETYIKKDYEGQLALKDSKIETLTETLAAEKTRSAELAKKLDDAYAKIEAMASKTVDGASSMRYAQSLEQIAKNQGNK